MFMLWALLWVPHCHQVTDPYNLCYQLPTWGKWSPKVAGFFVLFKLSDDQMLERGIRSSETWHSLAETRAFALDYLTDVQMRTSTSMALHGVGGKLVISVLYIDAHVLNCQLTKGQRVTGVGSEVLKRTQLKAYTNKTIHWRSQNWAEKPRSRSKLQSLNFYTEFPLNHLYYKTITQSLSK